MAGLISVIVLLYPLLAISIKRLHDLNLSGRCCLPGLASHYFLQFAPLIGLSDLHSPTLLSQSLMGAMRPSA